MEVRNKYQSRVRIKVSGFLSKYGDIVVMAILIIIGMLLHSSIVSLIITGIFAIYAFWKPKNALYILLIYVPTRPFITEIEGSLKGISDAVIIFSFLRVLFDSRRNWANIFRLAWFEWALFAYCVLGSLSGLITGIPITAAIFQSRSFLLFFLLFYIVRRLGITKEDVKKFLWVTFFMVLLLSIHGWIEKISIRSWLMPHDWAVMPLSSTNRIRIYGLTNNPNTLGIFLVFGYLGLIYLKSFYSSKKVRGWLNVTAVIALGTTILTLSRGVFLAFIFSSIVYFILSKEDRWPFIRRTVVQVVAALVIVALPIIGIANVTEHTSLGKTQHDIMAQYDQSDTTATERLKGTFERDQIEKYAETGRLYYVKKGLLIFKDHPIIGTGFDTFGDSATLSYPSPIYEQYHIGEGIHVYSDNQYIQVIAQTGIVGVLLFAFFLLNMLYMIWKKRKEQHKMAMALLAILLGIYLSGFYYNIWEVDVVDLFFFPMLALLLPLKKFEPENK
jgi:O-antigen ligase